MEEREEMKAMESIYWWNELHSLPLSLEWNEMTGGPLPKAVAQLKNEMKLTCLIELSDERSKGVGEAKNKTKTTILFKNESEPIHQSFQSFNQWMMELVIAELL